ncbi:hypothetical protein VTK26DRAFT_3458 [Humicola hyalothermophila]
MVRFFLVAGLTAVSVLAQDPSTGCTSRSFAIPSWFIQELSFTDESVSFIVSNRVTNSTVSLTCQTKESGWNACAGQETTESDASIETSVQTNEGSITFRVNETWECQDRGEPVSFTAVGDSTVALTYTSPILVKGSLTSPITINPVYAEGPSGHDVQGCTAKSENPSWVLKTIHFADETGDGITSVPYKNFNLLLENPANGYQASCMLGAGFRYNESDLSSLTCAGVEFQSSRIGAYHISTQASFQESTLVLLVNQTWFCDDTDPAKP